MWRWQFMIATLVRMWSLHWLVFQLLVIQCGEIPKLRLAHLKHTSFLFSSKTWLWAVRYSHPLSHTVGGGATALVVESPADSAAAIPGGISWQTIIAAIMRRQALCHQPRTPDSFDSFSVPGCDRFGSVAAFCMDSSARASWCERVTRRYCSACRCRTVPHYRFCPTSENRVDPCFISLRRECVFVWAYNSDINLDIE